MRHVVRTALQTTLVAAAAATVLVLDFPAGALAGCGTYGYGCNESACYTVEVSTDAGSSWQKTSAWIYGESGTTIDVPVRITMSLNVSQVQGWSLGLRHNVGTLDPETNGGEFVPNAAAAGPATLTAQAGVPPDHESTRALTCGVTQGVFVDFEGPATVGSGADLVIVQACYRVTFPNDTTVRSVTLNFTEDVGDPAVANLVTRLSGPSIQPCTEGFTLYVQPTTSMTTPSSCPISPAPTPLTYCE